MLQYLYIIFVILCHQVSEAVHLKCVQKCFLNQLLKITCVLQKIVANEYHLIKSNASTVEMPSLFPPFDITMNQIRFLKILNSAFSIKSADPISLILIGNELYRLTDKSIDAIAVFTDTTNLPQSEQTTFDIIDIQAVQWEQKLIFIVNTREIYNVYLLKLPSVEKSSQLIVLSPIQKIKRHGHVQITNFFTLQNRVYCILAANYLDEHRSVTNIQYTQI